MKFLLSLAIVAAGWSASGQGTSEAILGYSSSTPVFANATAGWAFQTPNYLTVTELGCFTNVFAHNPLATAIEVGLWDGSGSLLASNSITPGSMLVNQTFYGSVTPVVTLDPGTTYYLGVFYAGGLSLDFANVTAGDSVTSSSDIQVRGTAVSASGFVVPSYQTSTDGSIYAGANVRYQGGVPEPSPGLLVGLGGLLLAVRWRHRGS